jgi:hypothetical protein
MEKQETLTALKTTARLGVLLLLPFKNRKRAGSRAAFRPAFRAGEETRSHSRARFVRSSWPSGRVPILILKRV